MVQLTRLNGDVVVVNASAIDLVEPTPDTRLTLASGRQLMVRESIPQVILAVTTFYQTIGRPGVGTRDRRSDELGAAEPDPAE